MFIEYSDVPAFWHMIVVITPPKMMPLVMLLLVSSPAIVWSPGAKTVTFFGPGHVFCQVEGG